MLRLNIAIISVLSCFSSFGHAIFVFDSEIEYVTHFYPYGGLSGDVNAEPGLQPYKYGGKESNCTATQPVALVLVKERDGCFVDDFLDKDGNSEKAQMKEYLKTEQTQSRPDGHLNIVNPLPR